MVSKDTAETGQGILVTGANGGIGAAIARRLAQRGARLAIHYLNDTDRSPGDVHEVPGPDAAEELEVQLRAEGARVAILSADLSCPQDVSDLIEQSEAKIGPLTGLVNNAAHCNLPDDFAVVEWHSALRHFSVNAVAPAVLIRKFADRVRTEGLRGGSIVNISTDSSRAFPTQVSYGASKAALEALTRSAAVELGPLGIRVNAIAPGPVQTGWMDDGLVAEVVATIPLGRVGTPQDIAAATEFLLSADAAWVTGQVIQVDGGHAL